MPATVIEPKAPWEGAERRNRGEHLSLDRRQPFPESVSMPRKLRLQYPGAMDHLMSCGDQRGANFLGDVERRDLINTLAKACHKLAIAARLRTETTLLSVRRIAERLHSGKPEGTRANLHRWLKQPTPGNPQIQLGI